MRAGTAVVDWSVAGGSWLGSPWSGRSELACRECCPRCPIAPASAAGGSRFRRFRRSSVRTCRAAADRRAAAVPPRSRSSLISQSAAVFQSVSSLTAAACFRASCSRSRWLTSWIRTAAFSSTVCARHPGVVVIETPARVDRHAGDHVGLDRNQIEERGREVGALIRRAHARGLERARVSVAASRSRPRISSVRRLSTGVPVPLCAVVDVN